MTTEPLLRGKRIFIVEDDKLILDLMTVILTRHGATVVHDHWNRNTISLIELNAPLDIILLDLNLRHEVSGYDIFKQLQRHPQLKEIPVTAVSASDPEIQIPKAQALGMSGFISKPLTMQDFPQKVARCLGGQPVWDSSLHLVP